MIESNIVTFQRFQTAWDEYVDQEQDSEVHNKDKLKLVVTPLLTTPSNATNSPPSEFEVGICKTVQIYYLLVCNLITLV